jgi:hypothetical protein
MLKSPHGDVPPVAVGLTSLVLGTAGLLLSMLPILGIPLGIGGLMFALAGCLGSSSGRAWSLRWSITGAVVSSVAIAAGFALAYAPLGYEPSDAVPRLWQTPSARPFVSPPARPGHVYNSASDLSDLPD